MNPTRKSSGSIHWSGDFVEHVRTVHFALAVVAVALIIATTDVQDKRVGSALTQIEQIAKFEKRWSTVTPQIYNYALRQQHVPENWHENIAIVLPKAFYPAREIDTYIKVPNDLITQPDSWKFTGVTFPTEMSTLAEFRDYWTQAHKGFDVIVPEEPGEKSGCQQDVRIERPDGSNDLKQGNAPDDDFLDIEGWTIPAYCKIGVGLMSAIGGPQFKQTYDLYSYGDQSPENERATLMISLDLPSSAKVHPTQQGKLVALSSVSLNTRRQHLDEHVFKALFFSDWKAGTFEEAFPELNAESVGINTLEINDAVHRIEAEAASSQKSISMLGVTIPLSQLSLWAPLVLIATQLYFWLHLHELVKKIARDAEGWNVAWIGVYKSSPAFLMSIISACILPIAAVATLEAKSIVSNLKTHQPAYLRPTVYLLLSLTLAILTTTRLYSLRARAIDE